MLTKAQVKKLQELIRERYLTFTWDALGDGALSPTELEILKRKGIIRESVRELSGDAHAFGKIAALFARDAARKLTYKEVEAIAKKMAPTTAVERKAIEYARDHAGTHIRGIMDDTIKDATAAIARRSDAALRAVREGVSDSIKNRETISELKTVLYDAIDSRGRDWQRVAHTEINTSIQNAIYGEIREKSDEGPNQLVFKRPNPDACAHCKRVYLKADGVTPRIFKLSDLQDTNVGLKAKDWKPTIGSVHPWCNCQLSIVTDGHDFVKQRIIVEPFSRGPKKFLRGQTITSEQYAAFTPEQKSKTGWDAVLQFTGETGERTEKSMINFIISDKDAECICEHD